MEVIKWMEEGIRVLRGDSRELLKEFPDNYFSAIITDPRYE